ncbi:MAG: mechanosensitive ion channel [Rhodocyclaceae bacterium]
MDALLDRLAGWAPDNFDRIVHVAVIFVLAGLALRLIRRVVPALHDSISHQHSHEAQQRIKTLSRVISYALTVAVAVITGILILAEFGISVAPILGAAGVVGIAVGFGAQSLVKDYFTGFFLLLENQIRHGDVVEAGGRSGVVEELTLRYLRLRDYSGNVHYIPNGVINVVTNMSLGFAYAVVDARIDGGEDVDFVIDLMRETGEILRKDEALGDGILDDLEIAGIEQWTETGLVIRARFRVKPLQQWSVRREFLRHLKQVFDSEGIITSPVQLRIADTAPAGKAA